MEKFNRDVVSLIEELLKNLKLQVEHFPHQIKYNNNRNDFKEICDLDGNFTLRKIQE